MRLFNTLNIEQLLKISKSAKFVDSKEPYSRQHNIHLKEFLPCITQLSNKIFFNQDLVDEEEAYLSQTLSQVPKLKTWDTTKPKEAEEPVPEQDRGFGVDHNSFSFSTALYIPPPQTTEKELETIIEGLKSLPCEVDSKSGAKLLVPDLHRQVVSLRWGLIYNQEYIGHYDIEEVAEKPSFDDYRMRRCVVVVQGCLLWNKDNQPFVFRKKGFSEQSGSLFTLKKNNFDEDVKIKDQSSQKDIVRQFSTKSVGKSVEKAGETLLGNTITLPEYMLLAGIMDQSGQFFILTTQIEPKKSFFEEDPVPELRPVALKRNMIQEWIEDSAEPGPLLKKVKKEFLESLDQDFEVYKSAAISNNLTQKSEKNLMSSAAYKEYKMRHGGINSFFGYLNKNKGQNRASGARGGLGSSEGGQKAIGTSEYKSKAKGVKTSSKMKRDMFSDVKDQGGGQPGSLGVKKTLTAMKWIKKD